MLRSHSGSPVLGTPLGILAASSGVAWLVLLVGGGPLLEIPVLCTGRLIGMLPSGSELAFALTWISPTQLMFSWMVMLVAMMAPLLAGPIAHVRKRSLMAERGRNTIAFVAGYAAVWVPAGVVLMAAAVLLRMIGESSVILFLAAVVTTFLWLATRWGQVARNRGHAHPPLAAFGSSPLGSALGFGVSHGFWCMIGCAPIMLAAILAPTHGSVWMAVVALWIWAERLEQPRAPAFGLQVPRRALRAVAHRISQILDVYAGPRRSVAG